MFDEAPKSVGRQTNITMNTSQDQYLSALGDFIILLFYEKSMRINVKTARAVQVFPKTAPSKKGCVTAFAYPEDLSWSTDS